jgi:hypothetical protein
MLFISPSWGGIRPVKEFSDKHTVRMFESILHDRTLLSDSWRWFLRRLMTVTCPLELIVNPNHLRQGSALIQLSFRSQNFPFVDLYSSIKSSLSDMNIHWVWIQFCNVRRCRLMKWITIKRSSSDNPLLLNRRSKPPYGLWSILYVYIYDSQETAVHFSTEMNANPTWLDLMYAPERAFRLFAPCVPGRRRVEDDSAFFLSLSAVNVQ